MPSRRGANIGNAAQAIIQQILAQRQQDKLQRRSLLGTGIIEEQRHGNDLIEQEQRAKDSANAARLSTNLSRETTDRMAPSAAFKSIGDAKSLEELGSISPRINQAQRTPGITPDPNYSDFHPPTVLGREMPALLETGKPPTDIESLITAHLAQRTNLESELKRKEEERLRGVTKVGTGAGGEMTKGVNTPTGEFVPTELTGTQTGQQKSATEIASNSPGAVKSRAGAAGAVSTATSAGSTRGQMDVEFGNLEKVKAIAEAKHVAAGGNGDGTDSNKRIASLAATMFGAHNTAAQLENAGIRLKPGIQSVSKSPTMLSAIQKTPFGYSNESLSYNQAAQNFTNIEGLRLSGVTVREDERDSFLTTMFAIDGDPEPLVKQKQRTRETTLAALQLAMGGARDEAGTMIGQAINSGKIPGEILNQIDFDPVIKAAIIKALNNKR